MFVRQIKEQIEQSSDIEVSIPGLTNVQNGLQSVLNELNSYFSNQDAGHVTNAIVNLDGALSLASWVFFRKPQKGSKTYGESIATVQKAAEAAIRKVRSSQENLSSKIEEADGKTSAHEAKAIEISQQIAETSAEHTAAVSKLEASYQNFEAESKAKFDAALETANESSESITKQLASDSSKTLKTIGEHEKQARDILSIIGNIGVTGNYNLRASDEKWQADLWRGITAALFAVGVILVVTNLVLNFSGNIDITTLIVRFAIATTIALPAFYSAKESARHRSNADRAKQTELELASLGPFLEQLPDEQKVELRSQLTPRYFGNETDDHTVESPVTLQDVNKLIENLSDVAGKMKS